MTFNPALKAIWLSHPWGPSCPAYGGGSKIELAKHQSIGNGASSNSLRFSAGNHIGTHMDAPRHFIEHGRTVDSYSPDELTFHTPFCCTITLPEDRRHITPQDFNTLSTEDLAQFKNCDILLLRTNAETYRQEERYWKDGPGLDLGLADFIRRIAPRCRAVGIDSISITAFSDREKGRQVHREFLDGNKPIILIEDMHLSNCADQALSTVIIAPLRIESGDGAPVTVAGMLK
jgi:arylformamidase